MRNAFVLVRVGGSFVAHLVVTNAAGALNKDIAVGTSAFTIPHILLVYSVQCSDLHSLRQPDILPALVKGSRG